MFSIKCGPGSIALSSLVALSACSSAGVDTFATRAVPQDSGTFLQITAAGAGPLNGSTAYSSKAILAQLPDYTTGSVIIGLENSTPDAMVLFRKAYGGQVQALQILPGPGGKIGQIHGVTHHVVGPAGERPGMTFREAGTDPATCRIGTNLWLGMAICKSRGAPNVTLTYSFKGEAAMSSTLPPRQVLDTGELQRIIWTPPT
ncbi:DUF1131 family protein [Methyloraptor flagellatus]|jgi:hypothetical protein|uniref:DUF1131 family protein n=1 Tax=Methyloraptor flagellatus TaxID=3162530 RepID=A0AAU7X7G7_9HYPH